MPNQTPPPVPTQSVMTNTQGLATRPWIAWFTTLGQLFGFNQTIEAAGTALPQELALNFLSPLTATDNPGNGSTDIGYAAPPASYSVQFGTENVVATGNDFGQSIVNFPASFSDIPKVLVNPTSYPRDANTPLTCYATNITANGFTINLACAVPTGGGGATIDNQIAVDWVAIG